MKKDWSGIERYRQADKVAGYESNTGDHFGWFWWRNGNTFIRAMAVEGRPDEAEETGRWDHVSVSVCCLVGHKRMKLRTPTWDEMCFVKNQFWDESECVVQFHPPKSNYVNIHEHCLHLWRAPIAFPMPPAICV